MPSPQILLRKNRVVKNSSLTLRKERLFLLMNKNGAINGLQTILPTVHGCIRCYLERGTHKNEKPTGYPKNFRRMLKKQS
ncbi:hypothetical protein L211DRAFT_843069 [Terfezia boudieri ATCC MYA-4762]|uniref:Uncharacterized protein n=1 Tax=Terfezia boudieri ATCC MYA-4762 TaxID=1051890 RepID=A0A3N4L867_9PEZI|nr:hypothetical protein L211DRAFT_843069 [Terfezia boudieri ATCC MYA-4762]